MTAGLPPNKLDWDPTTHYQDIAVAERYDRERFSSRAGRLFNTLERNEVRKAFRDVPRSASVLDLPCGTGRLAETLLDAGYTVEGVDISPAMLHVAQKKLARFGSRFTTRPGDVHELARVRPKSYDVALCARVLMHFPLDEQVRFLRAIATLTRDVVVFSQSLSTPYQRGRRVIKRLLGNPAPAVYPITESELVTLLAGAGLREVRRLRLNRLISEAMLVVARHA